MKHNFMNKENGKVASVLVMYLDDDGHMQTDSYDKVEDLMEDYAAYKPAKPEPYIEDEKVREVIRVWAEANNVDEVEYNTYPTGNCSFVSTYDDDEELLLDFRYKIDNLTPYKTYTIPELIGEENE